MAGCLVGPCSGWTACSVCLVAPIAYGARRAEYGDVVPLCEDCAARGLDQGTYLWIIDAEAVWRTAPND